MFHCKHSSFSGHNLVNRKKTSLVVLSCSLLRSTCWLTHVVNHRVEAFMVDLRFIALLKHLNLKGVFVRLSFSWGQAKEGCQRCSSSGAFQMLCKGCELIPLKSQTCCLSHDTKQTRCQPDVKFYQAWEHLQVFQRTLYQDLNYSSICSISGAKMVVREGAPHPLHRNVLDALLVWLCKPCLQCIWKKNTYKVLFLVTTCTLIGFYVPMKNVKYC